jgi:hypothetical protein
METRLAGYRHPEIERPFNGRAAARDAVPGIGEILLLSRGKVRQYPLSYIARNAMSDMDMGHTAPETPRGGASRRDFIKGVIAAGAAVSTSAYLFRTSIAGQPATGAGERLISITVNGQVRRVDVLKQETLAMTLRYKLGLTGTKLGCDRCGMWRLHGARG